jgi:CHAD domain-containing protein
MIAIQRAILIPHDSLIQAIAVKRTPTAETVHNAHVSVRKFLEAFSVFHPQSLQ